MTRDICEWLESLGLGRYAEAFIDNEIGLRALPYITEEDLKEIGVALGARRTLFAAIAELGDSDRQAREVERSEEASTGTEAERRQLTVMFCDMVGSTALSTRLDPEDYRDVIRAYQDACAGVITRYDGYVAKFMGDGVLAYFGWPRAHEDDAEQAISAGLDVIEAVGDITPSNGETETLAVRIGIATGPVVVGDIVGQGTAQEAAVIGETPNLAARLQEIAGPCTIAIAATTHALAGGLFSYEAMGGRSLKGIDGSTEVWRVIGERRVESRFAAAHPTALTPLIGRDEELALLSRRWERAKGGDGQVVLLSGEAGIGKSRLTKALRDWIGDEAHTRLLYQCSPHRTSSALYPIISQLERAARIEAREAPDAKLAKLDSLLAQAGRPTKDIMPFFASLLSIPTGERHPLPDLTPQERKARTLAILVDQLAGLAEKLPVLLIFEDAHWIDPTSLELLELIVERITDLPVLLVITFRPEFTAPWVGGAHVTLQALSRLPPPDCTRMAKHLIGGISLPAEVMTQLVQRTDGVPLFIEELTRSVLDSHASMKASLGEASPLQSVNIVIPAMLQDALEARLDRSAAVREVAQVGAAIGREFPYDLLSRVASFTPSELDNALNDLAVSGLIFARGTPPDASYTFKHALVQDTAYGSMVRSKRQDIHKCIAEMLLKLRPEATETEPETLAHHYTEAGLLDEAVDWWTRAGRAAAARSANPEAATLLERGLDLVSELPASEARDRRELALQTALFGPLMNLKGHTSAEMEAAFNRALELCESVDAPEEMFRALFVKSLSLALRGQHLRAIEVAEELVQRAERASDDEALLVGLRRVSISLFLLGRVVDARENMEVMLSKFDRSRHGHLMVTYGQDPAVVVEAFSAVCHWVLGWPDKARAASEHAIAQALALDHVGTIGAVLVRAGLSAQAISRDTEGLRRTCGHFQALTAHHKMPFWEMAERLANAVVESMDNPSQQTATELHDALIQYHSLTGTAMFFPQYWGEFLAENYCAIGEPTKALEAIDKGFQFAEASDEHWSDSELYRMRGVALALRDGVGDLDEAETCLRRAIADAGARCAKSLELRAATSLAHFLRDQGRSDEAREILVTIYDWFTEGLDTPDLKDAKALLEELA